MRHRAANKQQTHDMADDSKSPDQPEEWRVSYSKLAVVLLVRGLFVGGTALSLGLWANREDQAREWSHWVYLGGTFAWMIVRTVFESLSPKKVASDHVDVLEKVLLFLVFLGMIILPLVFLATPAFDFANLDHPVPDEVAYIGTVLMAIGAFVFYRSHADLGLNWSATLEVREEHHLVTRGVYRLMRHPMYSALFLITAAQALLLNNWLIRWTGLVAFYVLYALRVTREERMMEKQFGEAYVRYKAFTPRLIPNVW